MVCVIQGSHGSQEPGWVQHLHEQGGGGGDYSLANKCFVSWRKRKKKLQKLLPAFPVLKRLALLRRFC